MDKPKNWTSLTAEEKRNYRLDAWVSGDSIQFDSPEAKAKYRERAKRFRDALELKTPDRVPIAGLGGAFVYRRVGLPQKATMYDRWEEAAEAVIKFQNDFQPDSTALSFMMPGASMEFLGQTNMKWAGYGLPDDVQYQYVEQEYMKADEYEHFLLDPSDFMLRSFMPRMYTSLKGLQKLLVRPRSSPDRSARHRRIHGSRSAGSNCHHEESRRDVGDPEADLNGNGKPDGINGVSSSVHRIRLGTF